MIDQTGLEDFFENGHDPIWRLENLYYIVDKNGEKVPFTPNLVQKKINKSKSRRKIILKARQFGVSTNELLKLADDTFFNENVTNAIIAHEQGAIEKLFRIVRKAYDFLPEEIRPELSRGDGSKYEMYFPKINSRIYCDLEIRGDTIQKLHVSEAAFMADSARLKATLQAVPLNGSVTIETTPNGMANYFYDLWDDPDSIYEKLFYPWYLFPSYKIKAPKDFKINDEELLLMKKAKALFGVNLTKDQLQFRRFKKSELKTSVFDKKRVPFEQEYPEDDKSCFLASGDHVINAFLIEDQLTDKKEPFLIDGPIRFFKERDKSKTYVCGADPSEGVGGDSSAAVIIEVETNIVCATINSNVLKPEQFAEWVVKMCDYYETSLYPPLLGVERNNHGHTVLLVLEQLEYRNIYVDEKDERPGWKTNAITRPVMVDFFVQMVESNELICNDPEILSQCLTLVNNKGKIEAATGKHDDLIIACCIALQIKPLNTVTEANLSSKINL